MANVKVTITQVIVNNSKVPTPVPAEAVDSEVVNNQVVARQDIVNPGVLNR